MEKFFQQIVSVIVQLNPNEHDFQKQSSTNVLRNSFSKIFAKFKWKHLRPVTLLKRDSSAGVFLWFLQNLYRTPLDDWFWIFWFVLLLFITQWTNRNQVFSIFEHVLSHLSKVMNIVNFAIGKPCKLYFAK